MKGARPLFAAAAMLVGTPCAPPPDALPGASTQPADVHNFVVIVIDDIGVDMIGAYERFYDDHPHPDYPNRTPCIDRLARAGLLFRDAWTDPVCSPTRAQILTGKHAFRTGVGRIVARDPEVDAGAGLQRSETILPTVLRRAGYDTAAVGKWHLADHEQHPPRDGEPLHPLGSEAVPWFHRFAGSLYNLTGEGYRRWTKTFATPIDPETDECRPEPGGYCEALVDTYATVDTADDAIHLIRTMAEPFLLYASFNAAHLPLDAPGAPLEPARCDGPEGETWRGDPDCAFEGDEARRTRCLVQWLDNEIGRVLCAIDERDEGGLAARTTVILMSDNGPRAAAAVAPFERGKGTMYEGGIRVPFVVRSPRIAPRLVGTSTEALVCATDLFATLAEIAGVEIDAHPDSESFLDVLTGAAESTRNYAFSENFKRNFVPTAAGTPPPGYALDLHQRAIRDREGTKLIQRVRAGESGAVVFEEELFDLRADPHERADLLERARAGEQPLASRYAALRAELEERYPHLVRAR